MRVLPACLTVVTLCTLTACIGAPHDALARLKKEPGTHAIVPASELLIDDAQQFLIVCPYVPADSVSELVGGESVKVPSDGYDNVLNALVSTLPDGSAWTQKFARTEVNFCPNGTTTDLRLRPTSDLLTFTKEGRGWVLTGMESTQPE